MQLSSQVEQIQALYEAERPHVNDKVYSTAQLPLSYEAITPEWLTDALCKKHPGAQVVSHRLDVPDVGSSNRRKIYIEYNEAGRKAGLPTAIFCKATHGFRTASSSASPMAQTSKRVSIMRSDRASSKPKRSFRRACTSAMRRSGLRAEVSRITRSVSEDCCAWRRASEELVRRGQWRDGFGRLAVCAPRALGA